MRTDPIDEVNNKITRLLNFVIEQTKEAVCQPKYVDEVITSKEVNGASVATNRINDGDENFADWLPLTMGDTRPFRFDLQQQKFIRDNSRSLIGNQTYKNIIKHYQNHMVGDGLVYELIKKDKGQDPKEQAKERTDNNIQKMISNWEKFEEKNNFNDRLTNVVERALRDGESPLRLFKDDIPAIRFVEPSFIDPGAVDSGRNLTEYEQMYGVKTKPNDVETILGYWYNGNLDTAERSKAKLIDAKDIIFIKRNTDYDFPRGISDFWPVASDIRAYEKIVLNTSVLVQIQSAIALVRKHKGTSQAKVANFVRNQSDGKTRIDTNTGKTVMARHFRPGMILDASDTIDYDFPAAEVKTENYTRAAEQQLSRIACNFVLPKSWLLAEEPTEPLSPGSPTVKNFIREQAWLYEHVECVFWSVQKMMGIDSDRMREDYELIITGPRLAVGKLADESRSMQVLQQCHAISPQTIAARFGYKYNIERANVIRHRDSRQDGEVMPGDLGNTDPNGNTGVDNKKKNVSKQDNAPGGDTRV